VEQHRVGQLLILRPLTSAQQAMTALRKALSLVWLSAVAVGLALTWLLSNRLMLPIGRLDKAAAEIARENYDHRVPVESEDELGRLARTFNAMCVSIQRGREELVRQERLSTIGRLSSSLVHDLRNPLAAIYAGSEMLAEGGMPENQNRRLAANIHRASRHIQQMLKELVQVCRGKTSEPEACSLGELIRGAWDAISPSTSAHHVQFRSDVPDDLEVWVERARLQRVFVNLFLNSVEAMPAGGEIRVSVAHQRPMLSVSVEDNGPGLPEEVRKRIFEPFVSSGKRNGMGLGLALARQTMRENGGDLSVGESARGARFIVRLPARENSAAEDGASGGDIEAPAQKVT
jgi:signal transduction histidine kinase